MIYPRQMAVDKKKEILHFIHYVFAFFYKYSVMLRLLYMSYVALPIVEEQVANSCIMGCPFNP